MFAFIVKRLGFMKHVPFAAAGIDGLLRLHTVIWHPKVAHYLDEVEQSVLAWEGTELRYHKYGGIQFNIGKKEIGHVHGNGLLDIHFTKKEKEQLVREGRVQEHHVLKNTGWVSLYIRTGADKDNAISLLHESYLQKR